MPTANPPNISFFAAKEPHLGVESINWTLRGNIVGTIERMHSALGDPGPAPFDDQSEMWSFTAHLPMECVSHIVLLRKHSGNNDIDDPRPKTWHIHLKHEENTAHGVSVDVLSEQFMDWVRTQLNTKSTTPHIGKQTFTQQLESQLSAHGAHIEELRDKSERALKRRDFDLALEAVLELHKELAAMKALEKQFHVYIEMQRGRG